MQNKQLIEEVQLHIQGRLSELMPNKRYVVEQLIAKDVWKAFSNYDRRCVGAAVAWLVKTNAFPLQYVDKVHGNTNRYQLI